MCIYDKKDYRVGFTLVELVIVVTIITILSSIAFLMLSTETSRARDSRRMADIQVIENTIVATTGKNKVINYMTDFENIARSPQNDAYPTNAGSLFALRSGYLVPLVRDVFDPSLLPTTPIDPKGASYLGVFLSPTLYQLFGTLENVNTKISTAYVQGTFKEGAIIDKMLSDITVSDTIIRVSHPEYFIAGDIIKIEDEYMVIIGIDMAQGRIFVYRNENLPNGVLNSNVVVVHNKGSYLKIYKSAPGADALLCKNAVQSAVVGNNAKTSAKDASGSIDENLGEIARDTVNAVDWGKICSDVNNVIRQDGNEVPYKVVF